MAAKGRGDKHRGGRATVANMHMARCQVTWGRTAWPGGQRAKSTKPQSFVLRTYIVGRPWGEVVTY